MRTLKTLYKRKFALFLAVMMCVSMPQLTVLAGDLQEEGTPPVVEEAAPTEPASEPEGNGSETGEWNATTEDGVELEGTWKTEEEVDGTDVTETTTTTTTYEGTGTTEEPKEVEVAGEKVTVEETTVNPGEPKNDPDPAIEVNPGDKKGDEVISDPVEVTVDLGGDFERLEAELDPATQDVKPKLPEGYEAVMESFNGTDRLYKLTDKDGNVSYLQVREVTDPDTGAIIGFYKAKNSEEKIEVNKGVIAEELTKPNEIPEGFEADQLEKVNSDNSVSAWENLTEENGYKGYVVTTTKTLTTNEVDTIPDSKPESSKEYDDKGNVIKEVTVTDETENGYKVTTVETNAEGKFITVMTVNTVDNTTTTVVKKVENAVTYRWKEIKEGETVIGYEIEETTVTYQSVPADGYPEKPEASDADGKKVTVTDIAEGNGYIVTTEEILPDGRTKTTVETVTYSDKFITTTTTSTTTEQVKTTDGKVEVSAGKVTEGEGHGDISDSTELAPDKEKEADKHTDTNTDLYGFVDKPIPNIYEVTASGLNVRSDASTGSTVKTVLKNGELFYYTGKESENGQWVKVVTMQTDSKTGKVIEGWVSKSYIQTGTKYEVYNTLDDDEPGLALRKEPGVPSSSQKDNKILMLNEGECFYSTGTKSADGKWIKVVTMRTDEAGKPYEGWVRSTYVTKYTDGYLYEGKYGLASAVGVNYNDGESDQHYYNVHQFIVRDSDGKEHYAYCADLSVAPQIGNSYGKLDLEDASKQKDFYLSSDQAKQINAIAAKGYWGTDSKSGSLSAFREWLAIMGYQDGDDLDGITEGMAMSITQAAIWYYGSSGSLHVADKKVENGEEINTNPFVHYYLNGNSTNPDNMDPKKAELTNKIYRFLIDHPEQVIKSNRIEADSITGVSITVREEYKDTKDAVAALNKLNDQSSGNDGNAEQKKAYRTDVGFVLNVTPSKVNDDLIVEIIDANNNVIATRRLAGTMTEKEAEETEGKGYGLITPDGNGNYIIRDVRLEEGTKITLRLSGSQTVGKAYLIQAKGGFSDAQTFITAETSDAEVDLSFELSFNVTEATATIETVTATNTVTNTTWSWDRRSEVTYTDPEDPPTDPEDPPTDPEDPPTDPEDPPTDPEDPPTDPEDPVIPDEPVPLSDDPGVEIPDEPTPLAETPVTVELAELPDEEVPLTELPDEIVPLTVLLDDEVPLAGAPELTELLDEDVPLADVPATGDISVVWYMLIFLAGSCLLLMTIADAKKRRESLQN